MKFYKLMNDGEYDKINGKDLNPLLMEMMGQEAKSIEVPYVAEQEVMELGR